MRRFHFLNINLFELRQTRIITNLQMAASVKCLLFNRKAANLSLSICKLKFIIKDKRWREQSI